MRPSINRTSGGFTLVEVVVALATITLALVGLIGAMAVSSEQEALAGDMSVALDAARAESELLASTPTFTAIYAQFAVPPLNTFNVPGLVPPDGWAACGKVIFPTIGPDLREDAVFPALGMPRDLNGDGVISATPVNKGYMILPVRILVGFKGSYGTSTVTLDCLLSNRAPYP
jgi:hypothetical protein